MVLSLDNLKLTLFFFKTDSFCIEVTIFVAATNDAACSVNSLRRLFTFFSALSDASLFETILGEAFFVKTVTKILRSILFGLGL